MSTRFPAEITRIRAAQAPRREGQPPALDALGVRLPELTKAQAEYLGVDVAGTHKVDQYRY